MTPSPLVSIAVPVGDMDVDGAEISMVFSRGQAEKIASWAPSIARLYLGHETGPLVQELIRIELAP